MMDSYIYIGELNGTRLGDLRLAASDFGLVAVEWADSQVDFDSYLQKLKRPIQPDAKKLAPYVRELREYLNGKRTAFTIPIDWSLFRPFQREALQVVYRIPYGETCTYHDIAMSTISDHNWNLGAAFLVSIGAFLFWLSDLMLAWNKFVSPLKTRPMLIVAAYQIGQISLIAGVIRQLG